MVRACHPDGRSARGDLCYPDSGYVACHEWQPGPILAGKVGGLWGFLHGLGDYRVTFTLYPVPRWQVLTVNMAEVRRERLDNSCRVPRAWVRYSGELAGVLSALGGEGQYGATVARNMAHALSAIDVAAFRRRHGNA